MCRYLLNIYRCCITIVLIVIGHGTLYAQFITDNYRLYTTADGLPSNQVSCLTLDSYGYLWVGTMQGVSRFNGTTFQNFIESKNSFPSPFCNLITQVNDSIMLIGTASGLVVFNLKLNRFQNSLVSDSTIRVGCSDMIHCITLLPGQRVLVSASRTLVLLSCFFGP
jgi:ligand-binding sensor domain-containing protein